MNVCYDCGIEIAGHNLTKRCYACKKTHEKAMRDTSKKRVKDKTSNLINQAKSQAVSHPEYDPNARSCIIYDELGELQPDLYTIHTKDFWASEQTIKHVSSGKTRKIHKSRLVKINDTDGDMDD